VIEAFGVSALGIPQAAAALPVNKRPLVQLAGRAAWALSAKRDEEARTLFRQLVTEYPKEPNVHYVYGFYLLENDADAAMAEFQKELQINPSHVPARLQIALLEIKAGKPGVAVEMARAGLKLQPGNVFCQLALGRALLGLGRTEEAIPELESAVKRAPENPQTHFYLEQAYRRAGRTAEAQKENAEFIRLKSRQDPLFLSADGYASLPAGAPTGAAR
jgi:predicted Zn-dependent protease